MAKNHHFLGLLCITLICLHFHFACYNVRPINTTELGSDTEKQNPNSSLNSDAENNNSIITETAKKQIAKLKRIYDVEVGVKEVGNNGGKRVEEYLAYVGLGKGHAWCAAFICWSLGKAGLANPKTAWSPSLFPKQKVIWSSLISSAPQPTNSLKTPRTGDVFGLYFPEKKRIAHAGFIDQWGEKWLVTVEGNTNAEGHRDGDGVYKKRRLKSSIYAVARYTD